MLHAPQDILRELIYGLNALLLDAHPRPPDGPTVAQTMRRIVDVSGARFGAPALLAAWRDQVDGLDAQMDDALVLIMEELDDQEDPYSAGDVLRLLQLEPFWRWAWDPYPDPEGLRPVSFEQIEARGVSLPLGLRPMLVEAIHSMEIDLFDLHSAQRSLYDQLDEEVFDEHITLAVERVIAAGQAARIPDLPHELQQRAGSARPLGEALRLVQGWKLAPRFDASPDEDDGEWTMRVLERLYRISWVLAPR